MWSILNRPAVLAVLVAVLLGAVIHLEGRATRAEATANSLRDEVSELSKRITDLEVAAEVSDTDSRLDELESGATDMDSRIDDLEGQVSDLQ